MGDRAGGGDDLAKPGSGLLAGRGKCADAEPERRLGKLEAAIVGGIDPGSGAGLHAPMNAAG